MNAERESMRANKRPIQDGGRAARQLQSTASTTNLLWLHTVFAFMYMLLTVYIARSRTSKMHYKEDDLVKRTLFISGISKYAEEAQIKQHFEKKTNHSKKFFNDLMAKEHIPTMIKPCGHLCCCANTGCEEEAVSYYTKREAKLKEEYKKEKVDTKPLGMAFVTFQNEAMTTIIFKDFNACQVQGCQCRQEP